MLHELDIDRVCIADSVRTTNFSAHSPADLLSAWERNCFWFPSREEEEECESDFIRNTGSGCSELGANRNVMIIWCVSCYALKKILWYDVDNLF